MDEQPSDLLFIQRCVREGKLFWTYHANIRLQQRAVSRHMVTESVATYEILEHYPESQASRYLPSCLVYARHEEEIIHILFALDKEEDNVRIITVYRPDPSTWEADLKRRKRP